jgi:AcrR family transcriptional regulator
MYASSMAERKGSSGARGPQQERSRETVRAILEAAEKIVAESGAPDLKMTHLATVAGVAVGTLYQYFPSREAVLRALEERSWSAQIEGFNQLVGELRGVSSEEAIIRTVRYAMDAMLARGERHGFSVSVDPETIKARLEIIDQIADLAHARFQASGTVLRPTNVALALRIAVKTLAVFVWLGQRDHPEALESGELQREIGIMIARYLLPNSADSTTESTSGPRST